MLQFDEGFITSVRRLTDAEKVAAMLAAADVQGDRTTPSKHVEPLRKGFDPRLRSVRVNRDLRIIVVECEARLIPLFVGHHETAYRWAATRRTRLDGATGAVMIVHTTEAADGATPAPYVAPIAPGLFDNFEDAYLLSLEVPGTLLPALRHVRSEDDLLILLDGHEAAAYADRLLNLATGGIVAPPLPAAPEASPAASAVEMSPEPPPPALPALPVEDDGDGTRSEPLRLIAVDDTDLRRMLAAPMEAWIAFLHPSQRGVATRSFAGPATISGGAGTGKTVVAMHRARHLARQGRRVLLTSFTNNARAVLERGVGLLCDADELARITVQTVHKQAFAIVRTQAPDVHPVTAGEVRDLIERYCGPHDLDPRLAEAEWRHVIQALGITEWEQYRDAQRTGRGSRLSVAERGRIWDDVILPLDEALKARGASDWPDICQWARRLVEAGVVPGPFDAVIVDETQDLGPQEVRLLAALAGDEPDNLTLVGDGGQRIYPNRTRLRDLGVEVRGRARSLTLNYRTTGQIHTFAEGLLGTTVAGLDGERGRRGAVVSLLTGPEPTLRGFPTEAAQFAFVAAAIKERGDAGVPPHEIAVLAPSTELMQAARAALVRENVPTQVLGRETRTQPGSAVFATIHRAKGLEFKAVFVVGASEEHLTRSLTDDDDDEATREQGRNLLYVAATRTRDELFVLWTGTPSRFLPETAASEGEDTGNGHT